MRRERFIGEVLPLAGLIVVLVIAYGLGRWVQTLEVTVERTFSPGPLAWASSVSKLLLAGLLMALWWLINLGDERSKLVATIYLLVGLLLTFSFQWVFQLGLPLPFSQFLLGGRDSALIYVGAFVAVMGLVSLFPARKGERFEGLFRDYDQGPRARL